MLKNLLTAKIQTPKYIRSKLTPFRYNSTVFSMSPALVQEPMNVLGLGRQIQIGRATSFTPKGSDGPTMTKGKGWQLPAGSYTPRQIVEANAPLLEVVLHHLGPNPSGSATPREMLLDNLASNLALETREASITIPAKDPGRIEMANQAINVGKKLIEYAFDVGEQPFDSAYMVRSPCEGHLLKPHIAQLMFGPRSLPYSMQIYNEYLHQMVLLRDALLPFENFEDVIIPIEDVPGRKRGIRHMEEQRGLFLTQLMTKSITQASVMKYAQSLLAPKLPTENVYGFQTKHGVVLPSFLAGGNALRLLHFFPAVIEETMEEVVFQSETSDYYLAEKIDIDTQQHLKAAALKDVPKISHAALECLPGDSPSARQLKLTIKDAKSSLTSVDLGQTVKGRRYAHATQNMQSAQNSTEKSQVTTYSAWDVLTKSEPGLITAAKGTHLIQARNNVELLALLGRLYPENVVVLKPGQTVDQALSTGIGRVGHFVVETPGEGDEVMPA